MFRFMIGMMFHLIDIQTASLFLLLQFLNFNIKWAYTSLIQHLPSFVDEALIVLCAVFSLYRLTLSLHMQRKSLTHICRQVIRTFLGCACPKTLRWIDADLSITAMWKCCEFQKRTSYGVSEKSIYEFKPHQSYWVIYTSSGAVKRTIKDIIAEVI